MIREASWQAVRVGGRRAHWSRAKARNKGHGRACGEREWRWRGGRAHLLVALAHALLAPARRQGHLPSVARVPARGVARGISDARRPGSRPRGLSEGAAQGGKVLLPKGAQRAYPPHTHKSRGAAVVSWRSTKGGASRGRPWTRRGGRERARVVVGRGGVRGFYRPCPGRRRERRRGRRPRPRRGPQRTTTAAVWPPTTSPPTPRPRRLRPPWTRGCARRAAPGGSSVPSPAAAKGS